MLRIVTANDRYAKFKKEDLAVGFELILGALLTFIVLATDREFELEKIEQSIKTQKQLDTPDMAELKRLLDRQETLLHKHRMTGWKVAFIIIALWSMSSIVRKWGWKSDTELSPFVGIGLPLAIGVLALIFVMTEATQ